MMNEPVSTIMAKNLVTVDVNESLLAVKKILDEKRIHHIPITDGTRLAGILTTKDLYKLNRHFEEYATIPVRDVMTTKVAYLEPNDKIGTAAEVFMEHLFHALPVVNDGNLVGIVTTFDLLKYEYFKEYPNG